MDRNKVFHFENISTRVALAGLAIMAVTALSVGFAVYIKTVDVIFNQKLQELINGNDLQINRMQGLFDSIRNDMLFLSGHRAVAGVVSARVNQGVDPETELSVADWTHQLANTYQSFLSTRPVYRNINLIELRIQDRLLVTTGESSAQSVMTDPEKLRKLMTSAGDNVVFSDFIFRPAAQGASGRFFLDAYKVIEDSDGMPFGMLVVELDVTDELINTKNIHSEMFYYTYITNSEGRIAKLTQDMASLPDTIQELYPVVQFANIDNRALNDEYYFQDGKESVYIFVNKLSYLSDSNKTRSIYIFNALPERFILKDLDTLSGDLVAVVSVVMVLVGLGAAYLSRYITWPIIAVIDAIRGMASGKHDIPLPVHAKGEIGILAREFMNLREKSAQAEVDLEAKKRELSKLIDELGNTRDQLVQSEKMASLGQLSAGIAHEINNPVGYVNSNLSTLNNYVEDMCALLEAYNDLEVYAPAGSDEVQKVIDMKADLDFDYIEKDITSLVEESLEGIERVRQIVQDLKEFSHVDDVEWQLADLHKGIESTLNIAHNELKYKVKIIKNYGELPLVECVAPQLNQVFLNMLVNAGQAIVDKGLIVIKTRRSGPDRVWVEFSDTGKGIPEAYVSKIFEPFFTTKPVGQGTGLGLSLSYAIIQKHGGNIRVLSKAGKGTTIRIYLPIKQGGDQSRHAA